MGVALNYYKRYRMELDLRRHDFSSIILPHGYRFYGWGTATAEHHAQAKFLSFHQELDAHVFPCLSNYPGCLRLMHEISRKSGFLPGATWLLCQAPPRKIHNQGPMICGTVQGVIDSYGMGSIQNLGIVPYYRGNGLGGLLLQKSLAGFQAAGLTRAALEVTAKNDAAIRLYKKLGFTKIRTVYKVVEPEHD
jgi:hypothetical protein